LKQKQDSGISFCVSYIHSQALCVLPMERAWKDNSNQIPF